MITTDGTVLIHFNKAFDDTLIVATLDMLSSGKCIVVDFIPHYSL